MKKRICTIVLALLCLCVLAGCSCQHEWVEATCEAPKTCSLCEQTEGEPLPHEWAEATCTNPKWCLVCGTVDGEIPTGHTWQEATCYNPKICTVCNAFDGEALEHVWGEPACYGQPTCTLCGTSEGDYEFHTSLSLEETVEGDQIRITCSDCGEDKAYPPEELMAKLIHGNWTTRLILESGTLYYPGENYMYTLEFPSADTPQGILGFPKDNSYLPIILANITCGTFSIEGAYLPCLNVFGSSDEPFLFLVPGDGSYELDPDSDYGVDFYYAISTGKITAIWQKYNDTWIIYAAD